ncbi:hypothetical protein [Oceanicoccus sp. KOV_DT_Chl]|uniref:hypothetical protein n=1 Tax=Oceanicoccus sp. KOV_DT_Chl TaxID=1904639 RepID=UPI000C7C20F3|nr:hypothetical protein [Oceanicoccus sp. KOV_DT_Chl]
MNALGLLSTILDLSLSVLDELISGVPAIFGKIISGVALAMSTFQAFSSCSGGNVLVAMLPTLLLTTLWPAILFTLGVGGFILIASLVLLTVLSYYATKDIIANRC